MLPETHPHATAYPAIERGEDSLGRCQSEIADPSAQVLSKFAQHPLHRDAATASSNGTRSLFELRQVLCGDADLASPTDELEAEELDSVRFGDATLPLVHDQLQLPRQKPFHRSEHAASTAARLDV